ncbi:hypothetical protein MMC12_005545 [Toensbergia leucococca]|nr:hypothetical protein [Toensbergia leucococca]
MAEAGLVIGLISGVIHIIEATKTVYDAAKDAHGQPEVFRKIASQLDLVLRILRKARTDAERLDETERKEVERTIKACREKAEKLQTIFNKVVRKDGDRWFDRYKAALATLGKGSKVQGLIEEIMKDIWVVTSNRMMETATENQVKELEDAIKDIGEMPSFIADETGSVNQTHHSSGHNFANPGSGIQQVNSGDGSFYHFSGDGHFGGKA